MTAVPVVLLFCDAVGCEATLPILAEHEMTEEMECCGWDRDDAGEADYCPRHRTISPIQVPPVCATRWEDRHGDHEHKCQRDASHTHTWHRCRCGAQTSLVVRH